MRDALNIKQSRTPRVFSRFGWASKSPLSSALRGLCLVTTLAIASPWVSAADTGESAILSHSLAGEFALQAGDIPRAAASYAAAAAISVQPELIERAATIALYAKDYAAADVVGERWLRVVPGAVGARRTLAWAALARGKRDVAHLHLGKLLEMQNLEGQRAAAQVLIAAENRAHAPAEMTALAESKDLVPIDNGPVWSAVASNLGLTALAIRLAEAETEANPKNAEAWRRAAQAHLAAGKPQDAREALQRAVKLEPEDFELRLALAAILADGGDAKAADKLLAQADQQDDRTFAARIANAAAKSDAKLLERIERALKRSKPAEVKTRAFLLGQVAELREQPDAALRWYGEEPEGAAWHDAQLRRAVLLANEKKQLAAARDILMAARAKTTEVEQRVDAYLLEAELLAPTDRPGAMKVYDEGISGLPGDARLLYARALFRATDGDISGLESDLRRILSLDPENPQALNALGYTLADRTDRHDEALGYIKRALELQPDDGAFVDSMGWVQFRLGNLDEALLHLRRAYELVPDGEVAAHLAEALWVANRREEARQLWGDALERWPENKALVESVRRLDPSSAP